jgi:hypothetical protein
MAAFETSKAPSSLDDAEKASQDASNSEQPLGARDEEDPTYYQVSFTGDDDENNPKSMSTARKWLIVLVVSTTSLCVACTSSLYVGVYGQLEHEFHSNETVVTLGLSMFVVGLGLSPMVLAPLSEVSDRATR